MNKKYNHIIQIVFLFVVSIWIVNKIFIPIKFNGFLTFIAGILALLLFLYIDEDNWLNFEVQK